MRTRGSPMSATAPFVPRSTKRARGKAPDRRLSVVVYVVVCVFGVG